MEDLRGKTSSKFNCMGRRWGKGPAEICFPCVPFWQRGLAACVL